MSCPDCKNIFGQINNNLALLQLTINNFNNMTNTYYDSNNGLRNISNIVLANAVTLSSSDSNTFTISSGENNIYGNSQTWNIVNGQCKGQN
jgi:hypothetical protein